METGSNKYSHVWRWLKDWQLRCGLIEVVPGKTEGHQDKVHYSNQV